MAEKNPRANREHRRRELIRETIQTLSSARRSELWECVNELFAENAQLVEALERCERLFKEALPRFDWGASSLDANAIALLNEVPGEVSRALRSTQGEGQ